jgi:hypothetical protein
MDQIFTVKQILEKCSKRNIDMVQIFTDFQQAYDSIDTAAIEHINREFRIPEKLLGLVEFIM